MSYSLSINAFRFDSKTDFLPYYKQYDILVDDDALIIDALKLIKNQDSGFEFPKNRFLGVKVNGIAALLSDKIDVVIKKFDTNVLTFEPLSQFNAIKDLEMDTSDFEQKIEPLLPFTQEEDKRYYQELITYYYASPVLEFERGYFGDSFMLFAVFLIDKYQDKAEDILKIAADERYGVWLHTPIKNLLLSRENATSIKKSVERLKIDILKRIPNVNDIAKQESKNMERVKA
jgi:hypothetical protein